MTIEALYYFHAFLNRELFDGELEAVIIKRFDDRTPDNYSGTLSQIETETDPFIIFFASSLFGDDPVFTITVLLHEMIHQYNRQRGIEDIDEDTGEHNGAFKRAAACHGLEMGGYTLTTETENRIKEQLKNYDYMQRHRKEPCF